MPAAFGTARSALRALGIAHRVAGIQDPDVHALFLRQLARRPARLSLATGKSELATSVGALATGAAWGLSEMQDPMAWEALLRYAEDEKNSESARLEAAHALGWVGNAQELLTLARRLSDPQARSASKEQVRMGLLGAFMQRPSSAAAPAALLPLISKRASAELRFAAAEAIGNAGQPMDETLKKSLRGMLVDPDLFAPAGLALILGGDPESAAAACKVVEPRAPKDVNRALERSIAFISMRDLEEGHLGRLVKNARACGGYPDRNARSFLRWRDRGDPIQDPHAVTPAVLRGWLSRTARSPSSDAIKREDARMLLDEMQ